MSPRLKLVSLSVVTLNGGGYHRHRKAQPAQLDIRPKEQPPNALFNAELARELKKAPLAWRLCVLHLHLFTTGPTTQTFLRKSRSVGSTAC